MILYLSSQKFGNDHTFLKEWVTKHGNKLLLIFNALEIKSQEKKEANIKEDTELLEEIGFDVKVVDLKDYFGKEELLKQEFKEYNSFCIMGGNTFVLRQAMKYSGFDIFLQELKNNNDYLYIGYSAGSSVLSKDFELLKLVDSTVNTYIKDDIINEGVGLIDYLFIPHYKSDYHKSDLIEEVVNICQRGNVKYKALSDGEVIIENNKE